MFPEAFVVLRWTVCRIESGLNDDEWALMGKRQQRPKPSVQDTMGVNTQVFETPVSYRYRCMEDRFGTDSTDLIQISEDVSITRRWWEKEACR
jgi:hypothetical protein